MIKSWIAYALSTVAIIVLGFVVVKIPTYPIETVVTAIVAITLGYFGKRVVQRGRMFTTGSAFTHNEQRVNGVTKRGGLSED